MRFENKTRTTGPLDIVVGPWSQKGRELIKYKILFNLIRAGNLKC